MYGSFTGELWVYVQVLSRVRRLRLVSAESIVSTTANTARVVYFGKWA